MKVVFFKRMVYMVLSILIFSCNSDDSSLETDTLQSADQKEMTCEITEAPEDLSELGKSASLSNARVTLYIDMDTDGDDISDYAENQIEGFDPNTYNDYKTMNPGTMLKVHTAQGIQYIPLYKMSFYQANMMDFTIAAFVDYTVFNGNAYSPWTELEKNRCLDAYPKLKKLFLTPEFRNFIYTNFGNDSRANDFYRQMREVKRNFDMVHSLSTAGISNLWNRIAIAEWVMSDQFYDFHIPRTFSHELVHHLGFGHNGIPYGIENKIYEMYSSEKYNYKIFNAEDINNYVPEAPCDFTIPRIVPNVGQTLTLATIPASTPRAYFNLSWETSCYSLGASVSFSINPSTGIIDVESFSDSEGHGMDQIQFLNDHTFQTPYLSGTKFIYDVANRKLMVQGISNGCGTSGANLGITGCWRVESCDAIPKVYPNVGQTLTLATIPASTSRAYFNLSWETSCYSLGASVSFSVNPNTGTIDVESFSDSEGRGMDQIQFLNDHTFQTPYLSGTKFIYDVVSRKLMVQGISNGCGTSGTNLGITGCWGS